MKCVTEQSIWALDCQFVVLNSFEYIYKYIYIRIYTNFLFVLVLCCGEVVLPKIAE